MELALSAAMVVQPDIIVSAEVVYHLNPKTLKHERAIPGGFADRAAQNGNFATVRNRATGWKPNVDAWWTRSHD
jgi:hypothetical protein